MKKSNRVLAICLSLVLILGLFPGTVSASDIFSDGESLEIFSSEEAEVFAEEPQESDLENDSEAFLFTEDSSQEMFGDVETNEQVILLEPQTHINPLYADVVKESDLLEPVSAYSVRTLLSEEVTYLTTAAEVSNVLKTNMKSRTESVTVGYATTTAYYSNMMSELFHGALVHTGNPIEGDYLKWHYAGWKGSGKQKIDDTTGIHYYTFTYTITYYTTADQEAELDAALSSVMAGLNLAGKSSYEKVKAIYDYICANVSYDNANKANEEYKLKYTAYAALINKTAVCQGYASLLYRMALSAGIDARLIAGTGNGEAHGWNIVKLSGKYYNLDSTWDAKKTVYTNFLKSEQDFAGHIRYSDYASDSFFEFYPMCICNYADHKIVIDKAVQATCGSEGKTEGSHCSVCGSVFVAQEMIPATEKHVWKSTIISNATVFAQAERNLICDVCNLCVWESYGELIQPVLKLSETALTLQRGQSFTVKVTQMAAGDYIPANAWRSGNSNKAAVYQQEDGSCTITAGEKNGKVKIYVKLASGIEGCVTVKVQKKPVKTTAVIPDVGKKLTLQKGAKYKLKTTLEPITSLEKVTYATTNKKVVKVSSKGVIRAVGVGKAKIIIKSGDVQYTCTVTVPGITNVKSSLVMKKGAKVQLQPKVYGTTSKVTYKSSNKKVAYVSKKGKITAKKKGKATITITAGNYTYKCKVQVKTK